MPEAPRARLLIVDDNLEMARLLADPLGDEGYAVEVAESGSEALALAKKRPFDLVITDLRMKGIDGFDVLDAIHASDPGTPVLIMTAFGAIESAVEAIRRGAYHYFTKPCQLKEVLLYVERALADRQLRDENRALRRLALSECRTQLGDLIGRSAPMRTLFALIERIAPSQAPVLIRGESGSGKELVARALHFQGPRKDRPFVAVNCTSIPEALLESELFGHVKGAFTSAQAPRRGLFVEADGGSLFLDEIGDMARELQAKLLRVLEDGEVRAVGSDSPRQVDVRIIAATHQDLDAKVREGQFRADLFYRLNVVPLGLPPLRERIEDIPLLCEHFLARARTRNPGSPTERIAPEAIAALSRYPWPGNVRELENVIERLVIVSNKATVEVADLELFAPAVMAQPHHFARVALTPDRIVPLRQLENDYIDWVVKQCNGNKTRAAELLGIDVSTIHRREREKAAERARSSSS